VDVAAARVHMVRMGFPTLVSDAPGPCACHAKLKPRGYICPRCASRLCELPTTCPVCSLQLVSAPALARSYHHLFPVPPYVEVPSVTAPGFLSAALASAYSGGAATAAAAAAAGASATDGDDAMRGDGGDGSGEDAAAAAGAIYDVSRLCTACIAPLAPDAPRFVCPECVCAFCADCDAVIHDTLHNCPGCV
jgi:transcription initiation factor TFIIH subunit 2